MSYLLCLIIATSTLNQLYECLYQGKAAPTPFPTRPTHAHRCRTLGEMFQKVAAFWLGEDPAGGPPWTMPSSAAAVMTLYEGSTCKAATR
jgi:hypothetical protein